MINDQAAQLTPEGRLLSLDFFRGLTMFLLIGEFTGLFSNLTDPALEGRFIHALGTQFPPLRTRFGVCWRVSY